MFKMRMRSWTSDFCLEEVFGSFFYFYALIFYMEIIKADLADISELNVLVNSAYRGEGSKKGWTTEAEILDGIRIDEDALSDMLADPKVTILKYLDENGSITGTVCLEPKGNRLYLGMFAVSPLAQGSGIGKKLMLAAEEFALENGCDRILISVIGTRSELIAWYKRHGYVATGGSIAFEDIEGRFGDPKVEGIELVYMEKPLT